MPEKAERQMTAWDMCGSILVGMYQAREVAAQELADALAAAGQKPFAPGTSEPRQMCQALDEVIKSFEVDLHRMARSSRLPMPEIKR